MQYANAQVSNLKQQRLLKFKALNRLDEYRAYHSMGDEDGYYNFLDLFINDSAQVYNDQLGLGGKQQISVKEYADRQLKKQKSPIIRISNVRIDRVWEENRKCRVEISYDKSSSYINPCGIEFSSLDFYGKTYKEKAVMLFDDNLKNCKIEKITGSIDSKRYLADNYLIFVSSSERDSQVKYLPKGGKKQNLEFNSFGQMLLADGATAKDFSYADPDVTMKPVIDENCHTIQMQYKARRWRVHPHFDLPVGGYYKLSTTDSNIETKSSGTEFGVDFGYTIPSKGFVKLSVNLGLGIATSKFDLSAPAWNYSYLASGEADVDGDTYTRYYEMGATSQSNSLSHLGIPIYVDADFNLSRIVSVYAQVGLKGYMKIIDKIKDYNSSEYIYGIYPQYDNLRLDEHWLQNDGTPFNGFGHRDITLNDVSDPSFHAKGFSMDLFGGFGVRLKPFKTLPLAFELGMQYQTSMSDIIEIDENGLDLSTGNVMSRQTINSFTINGGENRKLLSNGLSSMKRSHLKLNIGLIYRF
jgi:hypothetical protein